MDEIYNNPNLHSEEQDELEIPDSKVASKLYGIFFKKKNTYFYLLISCCYKLIII